MPSDLTVTVTRAYLKSGNFSETFLSLDVAESIRLSRKLGLGWECLCCGTQHFCSSLSCPPYPPRDNLGKQTEFPNSIHLFHKHLLNPRVRHPMMDPRQTEWSDEQRTSWSRGMSDLGRGRGMRSG